LRNFFLIIFFAVLIQSPLLARTYFTCKQYFDELGYYDNPEEGTTYEVLYNIRNNFGDKIKTWKICNTNSADEFFSDYGEVYCNGKLFFDGTAKYSEIFGTFYDNNGNGWNIGSYWSGDKANQYWVDLKGCFYDSTKSLYFEEIEHNMAAYVPAARQYFRVLVKQKNFFKLGTRPKFNDTETNSPYPENNNIRVPVKTEDSDYLYKLLKKRRKLCNEGGYWKKNECYYYDQVRKKMSEMGLDLPPY